MDELSSNAHIIGRYTLLAALITAFAALGGIYLKHMLEKGPRKSESHYVYTKKIKKDSLNFTLSAKGEEINKNGISYWSGNDLLFHDTTTQIYYRLPGFMDADTSEDILADLVGANNQIFWRKLPNDTIKKLDVFVNGINIRDNLEFTAPGEDLKFYHDSTNSYYRLPNFKSINDPILRKAVPAR